MAKAIRLPRGVPLLDIVSLGRRGSGRSNRLHPAQMDQIRRTVSRVPEVMVKVLGHASHDTTAVGKHLDYISRKGKLDLETDDGERIRGRAGKALLEDWDLELDELRRHSSLMASQGRKPPKIVHKLMFSMPPGTSPEKVRAAVRNFAREEFWAKHRYAFVLHTDEPHPHVHLVMKAVSEQGARLNIRKETLRQWRSEFARHLRLVGVAANATERAVRGQSRKSLKDGIYRANQRQDSRYVRDQLQGVATELLKGDIRIRAGHEVLDRTRTDVVAGWQGVSWRLSETGELDLAREVDEYIHRMAAPRTEREWIRLQLRQRLPSIQQRTAGMSR